MLAIEQMLIKNLNASITGHGQCTVDSCEADFQAVIDGKEYNITIEQQGDDDD
jgi:hypothetical protein|tara:strand:- start:217 stop:375 length:159 start_codon:yes stop_codon:yes gene_type:complete